MTPEGKVKQQVKRLLTKYGAYQFWPVQMGYGAATLDCLGYYRSYGYAIETKAPGKKPTKRQLVTIAEMLESGIPVFVIDGTTCEDWVRLENWLASRP